jgi:hypothetical protein
LESVGQQGNMLNIRTHVNGERKIFKSQLTIVFLKKTINSMKEPAVSEICNIHFNMLAKARHAKEVKMSQYSYSHLEKEDDLD